MHNETRPRIYVASLSDYNAGRLHGRWIEAAQSAEEIESEVEEMLAKSPEPFAEEWAIHDYEGFGPLSLSEWESFERVSTIALLTEKHGQAFAAWVADDPCEVLGDDTEEQFLDAFCGEWDSEKDYAEELANETNPPPEEWGCYIYWESYANTLFIDSHFSVVGIERQGNYLRLLAAMTRATPRSQARSIIKTGDLEVMGRTSSGPS